MVLCEVRPIILPLLWDQVFKGNRIWITSTGSKDTLKRKALAELPT